MRSLRIALALCLAGLSVPAQATGPAGPQHGGDNGDGTYTNPIIHADYSDPDAIRVEDDYYMTASSFNVVPGLPILHSKDLVNWRIINHALRVLPPVAHFANHSMAAACGLHRSDYIKANFIFITATPILAFT